MANPEHVKIVKQGAEAIAAWREANPYLQLDLTGADLRDADLVDADLRDVHLALANLRCANLTTAKLRGANMSGSNLGGANLFGANLSRTDLANAILTNDDLRDSDLTRADLYNADLREANMSRARLHAASLTRSMLSGVDLTGAYVSFARFCDTDLGEAKGLGEVEFGGPCTIGLDTLMKSQGKIPNSFLRGCGMQPWEVVAARIYDPNLSALEIADIQAESFRLRTEGPIFIGGVFISYAHEDSEFVDKVYGKLQDEGVSVWLDKHDVVAGPIDKQIIDAIRLNDIMLVVLSKNSVDRRWVQHEIRTACEREEKENRVILCPIALDDSWKAKEGVDWSQLRQKAVLDFSVPGGFDAEFQKLLDGMKKYYPKK